MEVGIRKGAWQRAWFMITEVSIRCQKKPGGWYTPYTRVYPSIHHWAYVNMTSWVCSIEYLTTLTELVLPTFNSWTVHKIIECLTIGQLCSCRNIYHITTAYFFWPTLYISLTILCSMNSGWWSRTKSNKLINSRRWHMMDREFVGSVRTPTASITNAKKCHVQQNNVWLGFKLYIIVVYIY